jgi:hypothetical protein
MHFPPFVVGAENSLYVRSAERENGHARSLQTRVINRFYKHSTEFVSQFRAFAPAQENAQRTLFGSANYLLQLADQGDQRFNCDQYLRAHAITQAALAMGAINAAQPMI